MGLLDGILADDANLAFGNVDLMPGAESVRFRPRGGSIVTYTASAIFRDPPQNVDGAPKVMMEVHLPRDSSGIAGPASLNTGGDEIELKYRVGDSATWYTFGRDLGKEDAGHWVLQIT